MRALVPMATTLALLAVPPAADAAFPGGNGRLVWKRDTDMGPRIWTGRLDGRGHRKAGEISNFSRDAAAQSGYAHWDATGRRLVYFDLAGDGVVVRSARGRLLRKVTRGLWDPDWSPDGSELIGYDEDGVLERVALDGRVIRRIDLRDAMGVPLWPRWSPAGDWIAFHDQEPHQAYISRVRPDGTGAERLTEGWRPIWSPDGRRIAFERSPDAYTMRADGTGIRRVFRARVRKTSIAGMAWSPDGRQIAISTNEYESTSLRPYRIITVPAQGGKPTTHRRARLTFHGLDWQPR